MGETFTSYYGAWTITVWQSNRIGVWNFTASCGRNIFSGTVDAYDRTRATNEVIDQIKQAVG